MTLSIDPTNLAILSATQSGFGSASQLQASVESPAPVTSVILTADDPEADAAKLANALKGFWLHLKLGSDAESIASALVSSMQTLVTQRPDLANAQFDFQPDNGAIKVTSDSLGATDKKWLQDLLNSNGALVQAVNTFHDDAVASYSAVADASGSPLTEDQRDSVGKQADNLVTFMELFKRMGTNTARDLNSRDTYTDMNGEKINLTQDPGTATGFLSFMHSVQALANGTTKNIDPAGHVFYGTRMKIFNAWNTVPQFYPPEVTSLGVHVTA